MAVQVKMLMAEAPDIATCLIAAQRLALEYIAAKRLSGEQIISISQHTTEQRATSAAAAYACYVTLWFDPERR